MGDYSELKTAISNAVKTNGNGEITGAVLQSTLLGIVSSIGANATFAGVATPSTAPGTPDQNVFYLAAEPGAYANFGGLTLPEGLNIITHNGSAWVYQNLLVASGTPGAPDISDIPLATPEQNGLMSAEDKGLLDSIFSENTIVKTLKDIGLSAALSEDARVAEYTDDGLGFISPDMLVNFTCATKNYGVAVGESHAFLYSRQDGVRTPIKTFALSLSTPVGVGSLDNDAMFVVVFNDTNSVAIINARTESMEVSNFHLSDSDVTIGKCATTLNGVLLSITDRDGNYYIAKLLYSEGSIECIGKKISHEVINFYCSNSEAYALYNNAVYRIAEDLALSYAGIDLSIEDLATDVNFAVPSQGNDVYYSYKAQGQQYLCRNDVKVNIALDVRGLHLYGTEMLVATDSGIYRLESLEEVVESAPYVSRIISADANEGMSITTFDKDGAHSTKHTEIPNGPTYSPTGFEDSIAYSIPMGTSAVGYDGSAFSAVKISGLSNIRFIKQIGSGPTFIVLGSNSTRYAVFDNTNSLGLSNGNVIASGNFVDSSLYNGVSTVEKLGDGKLIAGGLDGGLTIISLSSDGKTVNETDVTDYTVSGIVYHIAYDQASNKGYLRTDIFTVTEFTYIGGVITIGPTYDISCLEQRTNVGSLRSGLVVNGYMVVTSQNSNGSIRTLHIAPIEEHTNLNAYTHIDVSSQRLGFIQPLGNTIFLGSMSNGGLWKSEVGADGAIGLERIHEYGAYDFELAVSKGTSGGAVLDPIIEEPISSISPITEAVVTESENEERVLRKADMSYDFSGDANKVASAQESAALNARLSQLESASPVVPLNTVDPSRLNLPLFEKEFVSGTSTTEFTNVSGTTLTDSGWQLSSNGTMIKLNKYYSLGCRTLRMLCKLNGTLKVKGDSDDNYFLVNPTNKTISLVANSTKTVNAPFLNTSDEFLVDVFLWEQTVGLRIYDLNSTQYAEVSVVHSGIEGYPPTGASDGITYFHDYYTFGLASTGSVTIKKIGVYSKKVDLLIYGDSITECAYYPTADWPKCWTKMIIDRCSAMTSGRGGTTITQINSRIGNEVPFIKPKYVMVTIGTNGGNTESNLGALVDTIKEYGCECYLNNIPCNESATQVSTNSVIESVRASKSIKGVRFDVATSTNRTGQSLDSNLMYKEDYSGTGMNGNKVYYHHPNPNGSAAMFRQILIDAPEILVKE